MGSSLNAPGARRASRPVPPDLFDGTLGLPFDDAKPHVRGADAGTRAAPARQCAWTFAHAHPDDSNAAHGPAPRAGAAPAALPLLPAGYAARRRRWSCDGVALLAAASRCPGPEHAPPAVRAELRERLLVLLEWIDARLSAAVTIRARAGIREVSVFGTLVYRIDRAARRVFAGIRRGGRVVPVDGPVELLRPLATSAWLPAIAARAGVPAPPARVGAAGEIDREHERWLVDTAYALLLDDERFRVLRRSLRAALRLDAGIVRLARIATLAGPGTLTNTTYETVWHNADALTRVQRVAPGLLPLAWAYIEERRAPLGDYPLATLKQCLRDEFGIMPAGWRLVARFGERLLAVPRALAKGSVLAMAAAYANMLARAGAARPLPAEVERAFLRQYPAPIDFEGWAPAESDAVLRLAFAEAARHRAAPTLGRFVDELLLVCTWAEHRAPALNRTERRAGWPLLVKRARRWQDARRVRARTRSFAWPCPEQAVVTRDWIAVALEDEAALIEEAQAMRHCAWGYGKRCARGRLRLFSLRRTGDQRRLATASLAFDAAALAWSLDDVRGFANRDPSRLAQRAAVELEETCNQALVDLKLYALAGRRSKRVYEAVRPHFDLIATTLASRWTDELRDTVVAACGAGAEPYVARYVNERRFGEQLPRLPRLLSRLKRERTASR